MENLNCDIVTDLLPLYVDGVASEESQRAVEAHLEGCAKCREQPAVLQKAVPAEVNVDTAPLKKIKREIQKKRYTGMAIGVLLALTVAVLAFARFTSPVLLTLDQAGVVVEERDGELFLSTTSSRVIGWDVQQEGSVVSVTCWETEWSRLRHSMQEKKAQKLQKMLGMPTAEELEGMSIYSMYTTVEEKVFQEISLNQELGNSGTVKVVFYYSDGEQDILLYPKGGTSITVQTLPRLSLNYYLLAACGGVVLCGVLWLVLRKKQAGRGFGYAALFFVSYVVSHFAVMWGRGYSYFMIRDLSGILLMTLPLWGVLVLMCKAIDRGQKKRREMEGKR